LVYDIVTKEKLLISVLPQLDQNLARLLPYYAEFEEKVLGPRQESLPTAHGWPVLIEAQHVRPSL